MKKQCPNCNSKHYIKSGIVKNRQRYKCKECNYHFTVNKFGKQIDNQYIIKALQLYLEGLSYREIERIIGVSHVTISNWVRKHNLKRPDTPNYHSTYKILSHQQLSEYIASKENLNTSGLIIAEVGRKFMVIQWQRLK